MLRLVLVLYLFLLNSKKNNKFLKPIKTEVNICFNKEVLLKLISNTMLLNIANTAIFLKKVNDFEIIIFWGFGG